MNRGYGKIILLGEHFVVYGLPALVTALELSTQAIIEQMGAELTIIDHRPKVPTFKPLKHSEYEQMVRAIFTAMGIAPYGWHITLAGSLPVTNGGIGASAAAAVALARAINHSFSMALSDEQINGIAFRGEQAVHGTPSGIDNTAATFGGTFVFYPSAPQGQNKREVINSHIPLHLVVADSGRPTNTKHVLEAVSAFRAQNATALATIFERYHQVFEQAQAALIHNNLTTFGQAMTQNHRLLQKIGVSSPEQDFLVKRAHEAGALGAKLTGTGCGGLMIALAPDAAAQKNIAQHLEMAGFFTLTPTVNGNNATPFKSKLYTTQNDQPNR